MAISLLHNHLSYLILQHNVAVERDKLEVQSTIGCIVIIPEGWVDPLLVTNDKI